MSTRYSRGRASGGKKPHQRGNGRARQTHEVVLEMLRRGKPRQNAEASRTSTVQSSEEFKDFIRTAVANAPIDRRTRPLDRHELNELYGEDIDHIHRF